MQQNFYLGIDVSKGYADFIILDENKKSVEDNFQLDDTFEGHNQLYKVISGFLAKHPDSKIFAAVESTGGYENNWLKFLSKTQSTINLSVARVNPFGVSYNSKASLNRIITDKQSAKNVAEYIISHPEKVNYNDEDYYSSVRRQWTFIKMLTKQKVQLLNQLESLLYIANPEVLSYCSNKVNLWTLRMLKQYPTAKQLSKARVSTLSKIPYITESLVGLMIEILSVERFSSVKKLASFFGVHPVFKQSGDGLSGFKMSKRGRKEPRQILFNVARFAVVHNPYIKEIYAMHLQKGMPKMAALGAVMYKILRIVYGMLKNNKPFDPEIDRANRAKHNRVDNQNKTDYSRRYQPMDTKAPISRRQIKKRKEQEKSQILKPLNAESTKEIFTGSDSHSFPIASKEI